MRALLLSLGVLGACADKADVDTAAGSQTPDTPTPVSQLDADGDGYSPGDGDCDDTDPARHPGADERCNGRDDDCDGQTDEDDAVDASTWYADADFDGFGDPNDSIRSCETSNGRLADDSDCNDQDPDDHPGAAEFCDEIDNDCDGDTDEDAQDAATWYLDSDGDGYGGTQAVQACSQPSGALPKSEDCDDDDPGINPAAQEACDGVDNNCDELIDGEDSVDATSWHLDTDGDGFGDGSLTWFRCSKPTGMTADGTDCDDTGVFASQTFPGAAPLDDPSACMKDLDDDGYGDASPTTSGVDSGSDCDDSADFVSPTATEVCDESDNDCDGAIDDEDLDLDTSTGSTWYADADGDGHGDPAVTLEACVLPDGHVATATDCDDTDATVSPDDLDGDGLSGCDGDCDDTSSEMNTTDADGDGLSSCDGDCDDTDPADLCLLAGELSLSEAQAKIIGESADDRSGYAIAGAGDVDGDGLDDILIGAYLESSGGSDAGLAYLVQGPVSGDFDLSAADARLSGENAEDYAGYSVAGVGDTDGDGYADLLIGAYGEDSGGSFAGLSYLVRGPVSGDLVLSAADARMSGENANDLTGFAVAGAGDVDGDGHDDLLIGAYGHDSGGSNAGVAYLVLGGISGDLDLSAADARLIGESADDFAGYAVSGAGDVNGDGHDDLLIGAYGHDSGGSSAGAAYLVLGGISGDLDLSAADARLLGEHSGDYAGRSVSGVGDVDGDGNDDVLIGAYGEDYGGTNSGSGFLMLGPLSGEVALSTAHTRLIGETTNDYAFNAVSGAGDVNADGLADILVGVLREDSAGSDAGAAYLIAEAGSGDLLLTDAHAKLTGEDADDRAGTCVAGAGDVNGDGLDDLLIGAYGEDSGGSFAGATYLFFRPAD